MLHDHRHPDSPQLALVAEPQLDTARDAFLAAPRSSPAAARPRSGDLGPGWFESSWDLRQGLVVTEATADADLWSALYRPARLTSVRTAMPRSITAIA